MAIMFNDGIKVRDKGKRVMAEDPSPNTKTAKRKVLTHAQDCYLSHSTKRAKPLDQGTSFQGQCSNSDKVLVQFVQTLPLCYKLLWPVGNPSLDDLIVLNWFIFSNHGIRGLNDREKAPDPNLPKDDDFIEENVAESLYTVWPLLRDPSKENTQGFWNYQWTEHGMKLSLFKRKEDYIKEGLYLNYEFDLSYFLSIIVALLRSVGHPYLMERIHNGVRWFGVKASHLRRMLRRGIGDGVVLTCCRDQSKYLLLFEVTILLEYDRRTMGHEVINYSAYPQFQEWRHKKAFPYSETVWFVTKESNKQVTQEQEH